jgi:hypothetical protein
MTRSGEPAYNTYTGGLLKTHRRAGASITAAVAKRIKPARAGRPVCHAARTSPPDPSAPRLAAGGASVSVTQLRDAARDDLAVHLDDLLFRRVPLSWSDK